VGNLAKRLLVSFCVFTFLSCGGNADSQNVPIPQGIVADNAAEQEAGNSESVQLPIVIPELSNLTLIPSVEPELLRNVMPNSWHMLERLTSAEELAFISENIDALLEIERPLLNTEWQEYFSIYRQRVGVDAFYRIINTTINNPDFLSPAISFGQFLIHQGILLVNSAYNFAHATQHGYLGHFESVDIIPNRGAVRYVMVTRVSILPVDDENPYDQFRNSPRRNEQLFGRSGSRFYLIDDLLAGNHSDYITITASDALVIAESPLRYSLQNAFDGNPSTVFITNVEDAFPMINLTHTPFEQITRIAILNGYARDIITYRNHPRLEMIRLETAVMNEEGTVWIGSTEYEISLEDDYLSFQIFDVLSPFRVSVLSTHNGAEDNNVFIGGLNLYFDDLGWLFGDIYEQ